MPRKPAPKKIHINMHHIRHNIKCDLDDRKPPITIRQGSKRVYANQIEIDGPSRMLYRPDKPLLDCGARLILETDAEVRVID